MRKELPLHDATFDGIITSGKTATLYFTRTDGVGCSVTLDHVSVLQMDNFQQGNIAVLFEITSGVAPGPTVEWTRLFPPPHPSAPQRVHDDHARFAEARRLAIETGTMTLVEMQAACGAELLAICGSARLHEHGTNRLID